MCADGAEGGNPSETDQLVPALEETILQTTREDSVLRSDLQGECREDRYNLGPEPEPERDQNQSFILHLHDSVFLIKVFLSADV